MNIMLNKLKSEVRDELVSNILPFWATKMVDEEYGGFYGRINGNGQLIMDADKRHIGNHHHMTQVMDLPLVIQYQMYLGWRG